MATTYMTPGVYIEEVSTGAKPIASVGTSTAAFIGVAPAGEAHINRAVAINNWSHFVREFVGEGAVGTPLASAVFGFFDNGGRRCYVLNVGPGNGIISAPRRRTGLACFETIDEIAIVAAPGYTDVGSYDALLSHCEKMGDRFAILDSPAGLEDIDQLKRVATLSAPAGDSGNEPDGGVAGARPRNSDAGFGAFYFPWIMTRDPLDATKVISTPPSGHLAGIYAHTDATRGVHKAPANVGIRGALGLCYRVTDAEQGELNRMGVNCLRFFPDTGIRVWGARTLAEESSEWRYVSVRRLFNMIEESITAGTRWTVFEPNDERTWKSVERDVRSFLTLLWRDGALRGATPEQAFFVKCDAETNPLEVINAGRLVAEIGIAPVKPAEFIIFRIGQWQGGDDANNTAGHAANVET